MSTHDIEATIDDIYGFKLSAEQISKITDFTPFWLRYERKKRYFGLVDSGHRVQTFWMQIFDAAFRKSVLCVWTKGFEDGARAIFPNVVVQRCIVHLIRNSLKYVPTKDYKAFCNDLKKIYWTPSLKAAQTEFEPFCQVWRKYQLWQRNFASVEQLFNYSSAVRKIMHTTNAIEAVPAFAKWPSAGLFTTTTRFLKFFTCAEFYRKWNESTGLWFAINLMNVCRLFLINLIFNFFTYTKLLTLPAFMSFVLPSKPTCLRSWINRLRINDGVSRIGIMTWFFLSPRIIE